MTASDPPRKPRIFRADDQALVYADAETPPANAEASAAAPGETLLPQPRGLRWGALLLSAVAGLAMLSFGLWLAGFVTASLLRDDWIGWTALTLLVLAAVAATGLTLREIAGLLRLRRLGRVRADAEISLRDKDRTRERAVIERLAALLAARRELAWPLARLHEYERDVRDPGDLLRLAEREIVMPLDREACRAVLGSAKRVGLATAFSPMAALAVGFVLYENLRMMRVLAALYGGRPGFAGSLRLARLVIGHVAATGGIALTEDLLGQFLGQDLLRRLSRRLGEGTVNGILTARIGTAAIHVCRPLPFIDAPPLRARDLIAELFRR
ncbi:MAG: TIGR01620 family protein [Hyphomicrobiaceae bacterium]